VKGFFKNNALFLVLSLILAAVLGLALLYVPKGELHLLLCDRHTPARDIFYKYYTQAAEWFPYVVCVCLLLFSRIGDGVLATAAMSISGLATQGLKYAVDTDRPYRWFSMNMPDVTLPLVEGVRMSKYYSFPSGHTTSFFALAFVLCILVTSNPRIPRNYRFLIQILLFLAAAVGAYSRIYLSQHFPEDIFGGIFVGILITLFCYVVFVRFEDQKWYNYRLFQKK
jgi:membrane-associated phospholipid phosphatase